MAELAVTINGRHYSLSCDDGQEGRIRRLAQFVDDRVAGFVDSVGQIGESRLLLLVALVLADELSETHEALRAERSRGEAAADAAADGVFGLAERIEAIAARLSGA